MVCHVKMAAIKPIYTPTNKQKQVIIITGANDYSVKLVRGVLLVATCSVGRML